MSQSTYSVYLVEHGETGGKRHVTSPIEGNELQFYDTGVWLDRETGRNFFPYEQIRTIREHPEGRERPAEGGPGHEGEQATESDEIGGESTETDPETDPDVEGDSGAEEDMLEE